MKMRKNKLINLLKIGILCFGISILLFNCEKNQNDTILEPVIQTSEAITTNTDFSALQNDPLFANFINELQLEKLTNLNPNIKKKTQNGELTLVPNIIKKVVQGNKVSYNILAKRQGQKENIVENVVLQNINGEYRSLLIKYTFKQINKSSKGHFHKMGNSLDVELDQVEIDNYGTSNGSGGGGLGTDCEYETIYIDYSCYGPGSAGSHYSRSQCACGISVSCSPPRSEAKFVKVCKTTTGDIYGSWTSDLTSNDTSGGSGGGSAVASIGSGVSAFAYENPEGAVNLIASKLSLNQNQIDFLNDNEGELVSEILNLLGISQGEDFAKLAIEALMNGAEVDFDDQIIDELTGKAKCLNSKLTEKGNNFVQNILNKFQGEKSKFSIKIKSKDKVYHKGKEVNGLTRYTSGTKIINIDISTNKLSNRPALSAARTIIHEYIHADMIRKLYNNQKDDLDFKTTYEKYETEKQHNTMAELYVNSIRDALKSFHKTVLVGDYNYLTNNGANPLPDNFYEALAWQGLKNHDVKAYRDLTDSKKKELSNSLNKYYHSTTKNCPK